MRFRRPDGQAVPTAPSPPEGVAAAVPRLNGTAGVTVDDTTCVPCVHSERMQLPWIVDGLAEADPRLRALDARQESVREPEQSRAAFPIAEAVGSPRSLKGSGRWRQTLSRP